MQNLSVRTRIAPSPTGFMHIGNLRTALTNYLFAKKNQGTFIVRLEDTDQKRFVEGATQNVIESLKWAGLDWQEGINLDSNKKLIENGSFGPYIQSKRLKIYQKYAQELISKEKAYYCFCSSKRLETLRKQQSKEKQAPKYDKKCLALPQSKIKELLRKKESYVIRLRIPETGITTFNDLIRGKISIENKLLDDQILIKSDGFPTYHFAVVIDDYLMKITHILRAEEWVSSTPKHILLYKAFNWPLPNFGHIPQLLNLNGKKLSKRDGDVAVRDFQNKGYLPETIINFIALLGWNPKTNQEIFTLKELEEQFDLKKINKAGAKFDYQRLNWFSSHYIKKLSTTKYLQLITPFSKQNNLSITKFKKIALLQKERIGNFSEILKDIDYLTKDLADYPKKLLFWKKMDENQVQKNLTQAKNLISELDTNKWELPYLTDKILNYTQEKRGEFLWPLRVALTGKEKSISPFECLWVLEKEETLKRIELALKKIQS